MSLTLLQSVCDKHCLCERVLPFEPLFAVLYMYNMLSRGCLNTHTDIYKELTILIQFSNRWGLQCEKAMFSILVSSIRFWSFFFLGILYQCFRILLCLCFLSICCELGFLFWRPIYICLHIVTYWWGSKMIQVGVIQMQAAVSSFQAFSVEGFCCPILVVHLSWIKTPDPCLKFCTNIIIHKNSFSTECIHTHVDVYMCRQNPHVNNMKYGFLKFHININTCRYKLWAIFQLLSGQNFTSCYLLPLLGIDC